jgi:hypothetical protein
MINAVIDAAWKFVPNKVAFHGFEVLLKLLSTRLLIDETVYLASPLANMANGTLYTTSSLM